ncbi:MAG: membrane dipeptidase [Verrucomicrobia bacterium]|nr:membrane dipeptidase [Verrucomicrobiota bacterium]
MKAPFLIFDSHLDLAMNALEWNRDLTQPIAELRAGETGRTDKPDRGNSTVSLPEMRRGGVGLCVATLIARVEHNAFSPVSGWRSPTQAWAQTQGQLAWYRAMEEAGEMVQIHDAAGLEKHLALWNSTEAREKLPIGYVLSLEGADSILSLDHLARAREQGLRAIGPAHYGPGVYANGTGASGGFNAKGRELLKEMDRLGFILDATHLCDDCFWEALDLFHGPVWASHQNCRALVPHPRQFSDEQLKALIARGAVIGTASDGWMLVPGWVRGKSTPQSAGLTLEHFVTHIDHVCQLAGNARHAGIGSDLDGAFGREQTPVELATIAGLVKLPDVLARRGYTAEDVEAIMSKNFSNFAKSALSTLRK